MHHPNARKQAFAVLLVLFVALAGLMGLVGAPAPAVARAAAPAAGGEVSNGWELVFQAPAYASGVPFHFYGMTFVTREVGFAFGGDKWRVAQSEDGRVSEPARIYRTKDGGQTWREVYRGGGASDGWKIGLVCADTLHCWAGGKGGFVHYTQDGGDTWAKANTYTWYGLSSDPRNPQPTPVVFADWIRSGAITTDGSSIIFGATDNVIIQSSDGKNFYNYWPPLAWYVATWGVTCTSPTICYGGQINRQLVKSTDGGKNWFLPAYVGGTDNNQNCLHAEFPDPDGGIQRRYYGLGFVNDSYGWTVGSCGAIYRTTNGAQGWQAQNGNIPLRTIFREVQAYSKSSAVAAGGVNPDPADPSMALNAVIYRTTDGQNWSQVAAPDTSELHGLAGFQDATYVADWSGKIWRWDGSLAPIPNTPTPTATSEATETPTATSTATASPTATVTPTATETSTATPTASATPSTGDLGVLAFHDANADGKQDPGETLLSGVGYRLSRELTPVATGVTGTDGRYVFSNLKPGLYRIDETTPPAGYTANRSDVVAAIAAGTNLELPFPHRMSTVTPEPTATSTRTPQPHWLWLPVLMR